MHPAQSLEALCLKLPMSWLAAKSVACSNLKVLLQMGMCSLSESVAAKCSYQMAGRHHRLDAWPG